jgi:hypothetical protein
VKRAFFVVLVACSSPKQPAEQPAPAPAPAEPSTPAVMTKEECEAKGARVNASIGGGSQAHCNADETELAPVRLGIEGGWCCELKK